MLALKRRLRSAVVPLLIVPAISIGVAFTAVLAAASPAGATTCTATASPSSPCADTGTLTINPGTLTAVVPNTLTWTDTLTGLDQTAVDSADASLTVIDATGSGTGWNVAVSATQFTTGGDSPHTLSNSGTFDVNGSDSSATATSAPGNACSASSTCLVPTDSVSTYPVDITTAASDPTAEAIYGAEANSGMGSIDLSDVDWWLSIPADTYSGSYTSTVTISVGSGPTYS